MNMVAPAKKPSGNQSLCASSDRLDLPIFPYSGLGFELGPKQRPAWLSAETHTTEALNEAIHFLPSEHPLNLEHHLLWLEFLGVFRAAGTSPQAEKIWGDCGQAFRALNHVCFGLAKISFVDRRSLGEVKATARRELDELPIEDHDRERGELAMRHLEEVYRRAANLFMETLRFYSRRRNARLGEPVIPPVAA